MNVPFYGRKYRRTVSARSHKTKQKGAVSMYESTTPTVRELIDRAAQIYEDKTFIKFVREGKIEERSYRTTQQNALAVCRWIRSLSK